MSIHETLQKIKPFYTLILILVLASIFFALGRLSAIEDKRNPIKIEYPNQSTSTSETANVLNAISTTNMSSRVLDTSSGEVIGSKTGRKYYFPWCGTVKLMKLENQVKFASIEEAKKAGFVAGGNCKGLQ